MRICEGQISSWGKLQMCTCEVHLTRNKIYNTIQKSRTRCTCVLKWRRKICRMLGQDTDVPIQEGKYSGFIITANRNRNACNRWLWDAGLRREGGRQDNNVFEDKDTIRMCYLRHIKDVGKGGGKLKYAWREGHDENAEMGNLLKAQR